MDIMNALVANTRDWCGRRAFGTVIQHQNFER
jgi:hypothetical protein